jgi:signal transduction histidine kinase
LGEVPTTAAVPQGSTAPPAPDRAALLLEAGVLLASDLSPRRVLERLVELAARVTGARYAAFGVLGEDGRLLDFIPHGLTPEQVGAIGPPPQGRGILRLLVERPEPLRLARISDHPSAHGFPPGHPPMTTFLGVPVRGRGAVLGNLYLTDKEGGAEFDPDDEAAVSTLAALAGAMVVNGRAYRALEQRETWLRALQQTTDAMLQGASVQGLLRAIVRAARELTDAELACVVLADRDRPSRLRVAAVAGPRGHRLEHLLLPERGTASLAVSRAGRPRLVTAGSRQLAWLEEAGVTVGPAMVLPLTVDREVAGTLLIAGGPDRPPFRHADLTLVDSFASQAALAIDHVRLQESLQHLAVLEERRRIARDLHDEPVQALIYLARRLERVAAQPEVAGVAAAQLGEVRDLAVAVADGLRQLTEGLRSEVLEESGLPAALSELGRRFEERSGLAVRAVLDEGAKRWPLEVEKGWLRIAQEALSNVERHARAAHVEIGLRQRGDRLLLWVRDDGVGFPVRAGRPLRDGLGFLGMRERAALLGGALRVCSGSGLAGTLILARVRRAPAVS